MNRKSTLAVKVQKNILMVIIAISLLSIVAYNLFSKASSEVNKSQISFFVNDAISGEHLSDVSISFIQGMDNPEGESFKQLVIGENEVTVFELPYGEYTVQWFADGYYTGYQNVEVRKERISEREWLIPIFEENAAYVLVEWEPEIDLDLCVYNEQTGRCIGKETTLEDAGSFSYGDNDGAKGYELVYLSDYDQNAYRVYVKRNENLDKNQRISEETVRTAVSIYTSNGLLYQKESDDIQGTALWHCADIRYGQIKEWDEYIFDLTEYIWATRDKGYPEGWIENANIKAEEKYEYSGGTLFRITAHKYDINGKGIAYSMLYESDGPVIIGYENEYDENGQLVTKYVNDYGYTADGRLISKYEYRYEDNREIVLIYGIEGELIERKEYDRNGNLISRISYSSNGKLIERKEYKYGRNGNLISEISYNSNGKLIERKECEYDRNGNLISQVSYDSDGELTYREEREYDRNGKLISEVSYDSDGLYSKWEYEYDLNGNELSEFIWYRDGWYFSSLKREYDDNNKLITLYVYDENGSLKDKKEFRHEQNENGRVDSIYNDAGQMTYKSEYDTHGNITGSYQYEDGAVTSQHNYVYDENDNQIETYEYRDGKLKTRKVCEFNENGECTLVCIYNGNGSLKSKTTYDHVYEYDAVGGMKIFYYYVNDVLTTKTITLFY